MITNAVINPPEESYKSIVFPYNQKHLIKKLKHLTKSKEKFTKNE